MVTAAAGAFSQVLFSWYYQPFIARATRTAFTRRVFDLRGVAFAAWTLTAFAIGALAGMLIRRVVPAIAADPGRLHRTRLADRAVPAPALPDTPAHQ